jgi:hypothetical protein
VITCHAEPAAQAILFQIPDLDKAACFQARRAGLMPFATFNQD